MTTSSLELPAGLPSLWRSFKLGFRVEPMLLVVAGVTTLAAALPDALFAVGLAGFASAVVSGNHGRLLALGVLLAVLTIGTWLLNVVGERLNLRLAERAAVPIESHMARLQSSVTTIEHQERADYLDLLALLRDHAGTLSQLYQSVFRVSGAVVRLLLTVGLLASVRPWLALLVVFAVPSVVVGSQRAAVERRVEDAGAADRRLARHLFVLGATATSSKEIRVAGMRSRLREMRAQAWRRQYQALARARWIGAVAQSAAWAVFGTGFTLSVVWVALGPGSGAARAGSVVLVVAAGARLSEYVGQTVNTMQGLRLIWLEGARRLAWLEDYAADSQGEAATQAHQAQAPQRLREGIRFEQVSFGYATSSRPVLEDVNLTLRAGTVVAVVGENGAGKTTLVKLLCRFYQPTSGRITVDGIELNRITPPTWRRRLAGTFQDFVRFELPARQAIGIGDLPRADDEAAIAVAVARAGADDVVAQLPHGLDTQLGNTWPGGVEVSYGQWQRLALARGFMRDAPLVLVLDEPTAALDAETEHAIFQRFADAAKADDTTDQTGRITVLVSHRFSTVRMADVIVVLDGSRVLEVGSHQELMDQGGRYAELYNLQAASYR